MRNAEVESLLREFAKEALIRQQSRLPPVRKSKKPFDREIVLIERHQHDFSLKRVIKLKESYVVGVLGIQRKTLRESANDPFLNDRILREHLLFEGFFDGVKNVWNKVVDKAESAYDAVKEYGQNANTVAVALFGMMRTPSNLGRFMDTAKKKVKEFFGWLIDKIKGIVKGLGDIAKAVASKTAKFLGKEKMGEQDEGKAKESQGIIAKTIESLKGISPLFEKAINAVTAAGGWKIGFYALGLFLLGRWLKEKFGTVLTQVTSTIETFKSASGPGAALKGVASLVDGVSGFYDQAKKMADVGIEGIITGADEEEDDDAIPTSINPVTGFCKYIKKSIVDWIKETLKNLTGELGAQAVAALSGPIGWLKQAYSFFQSSKWVLASLAIIIKETDLPLEPGKEGEKKEDEEEEEAGEELPPKKLKRVKSVKGDMSDKEFKASLVASKLIPAK